MTDTIVGCLQKDGTLRLHEERYLEELKLATTAAEQQWDTELDPSEQESWLCTLASLHDEHGRMVWELASQAKRAQWVAEARDKFIYVATRQLQVCAAVCCERVGGFETPAEWPTQCCLSCAPTQEGAERQAHVHRVFTFLSATGNAGHPHRTLPHVSIWLNHGHHGVRLEAAKTLHTIAKAHSSDATPATRDEARRLATAQHVNAAAVDLASVVADTSVDLAARVTAIQGFHAWPDLGAGTLNVLKQALLAELQVSSTGAR